jgi:predicted RecA/RadA family phage recombinase
MPLRNKNVPIFRPGAVPSVLAKTDVLAGRFIDVTTDGVDATTQLTNAGYPAADAVGIVGVAMHDAPAGREVAVWHTGVVEVTASAAITAGAFVGTTATGQAKVAASAAAAVGKAWSNAASGAVVRVQLFN